MVCLGMNQGILGMTVLLICGLPGFQQQEQQFLLRQQQDDSCGFACAATLLNCYWNIPTDEISLIAGTLEESEPSDHTISFLTLEAVLSEQGISSQGFFIDQEHAAGVCRDFGPVICWEDTQDGHFYLLLDVLDVSGETIYVTADPKTGIAYEDETAYSSRWSGRVLVSAFPGGRGIRSFREEALKQLEAHRQVHQHLPPLRW